MPEIRTQAEEIVASKGMVSHESDQRDWQGTAADRVAVLLRALRHRNFRLFFGGQLISLIGTWMQTVAESWLVYRLTGSAWLLGIVGFSSQIPVFLMAPIGGIVADRMNRHRVIIATQSAAMTLAMIYALLTLSGRIKVWEIIVLAALLGVVNAFDIPARQAFLVDMVGRDDLLNAIALNSSMFNGARIIGPAIAGILVASIGEGWCFFANSVSYIAVITGLLLMHLPRWIRPESLGSHLEDIIEGFRFAQQTMPVRALLMLVGLVSLVGMPYSVLMPIFAAQILHGGARALGSLMGATGVGALLGALTLAAKREMRGLSRWIALSTAAFGVSLIVFAFSRWFYLSLVALVPVGFSMMIQMASSNTLLQAMSPDRLRGRVMALYSMMFMGMAPIGALGAGAAAHALGAPLAVAVGGVVSLLAAALFTRYLPQIRGEARQLIIAQGMAGGEPAGNITARTVT